MKKNSFAAESLYNHENCYEGKRISVFSMISVAGSFLINALIVGYAIVMSIIA